MEEPSSIQSADSHWLESIKIELAELSPLSSSWTICRVPTKLRNTNKDAYTPHIISVGPIHHEERSLKGMEAHKWRYMLSLLERTQNAVATLDACGKAILRFDNDVRASYAEWINYSNTDLAKMMLLDGCFILELLLRYSNPDPKLQSDPIFTTSWMILTLQRDLALLENQIPFFVLEWLFNFTVRRTANGLATPSLPDLALRFFRSSINNVNEETLGAGGRQNSHHLLHLIHNCYFPSSPRIETKGKRNSNNIEFIQNFIAFEQCFQESSQYITSYVLLMDRLIDTAKDVEVLERRRIVANDLGGRDDVAAMFNNICKQIVLRDFYFAGLCEQVNEYYHRRWNRYKASLKRDYCTNPWTIISLLGAFILISLTAVQTVYSVLGYYPH
ncbi:unnamed protein product [Linum tenue]|uniref:Uncharacterized protein n=1 Tax=Linum tenue TaxID=586396 RepID=A0AAV0QXJ0_9ROSI|nr:unnamed protein product [Linum tenue]